MYTINYLLNNSIFMLLLGLIIGLAMSFLIARWTVQLNEEAKARRKLCDSFNEFLAWFEVKDTKNPQPDWFNFIRMQKTAIRGYRRFINPKDRIAFDSACSSYFNQKTKEEHINNYWNSPKELYDKIEAIMKFAIL